VIGAERHDLGGRQAGLRSRRAGRRAERGANAGIVQADSRISLELVVDLRSVSGAEARARPWLEQYAGRIAEAPVVAADFGEAVLGCRFGAGDPVERAERAEVDRVC
jgi:hypothetical protein